MNQKIKIDLSTFFDDERKYCCVLLDPKWKSVACLQNRVQLLFNIDCVRFLSDGCYLHPQESIAIIKLCEELKAFVPKESRKLRKNKKSQKLLEDFVNGEMGLVEFDQQINDSQKKRKCKSVEKNNSLSSSSSKSKRSKNVENNILESLQVLNKEVKIKKCKEEPFSMLEPECAELTVATTDNLLKDNSLVYSYSAELTLTSNEMKKSELSAINTVKCSTAPSSCILSSTFLNENNMLECSDNADSLFNSPNSENRFKNSKSKRTHIYFNKTGELLSPTTKAESTQKKDKEPKTIVIFRCPLSDITNNSQPQKPRIFELKSVNMSIESNTKKNKKFEIQENILLPPLSILNESNETFLANEKILKSEVVEQKEVNGTTKQTAKADSLNDKNDEEQANTNGLEHTLTTETRNESKMKQPDVNETSIISVDCVDLSNDLDEDDIVVPKSETIESKHEQRDLTTNESRKSSASDVEEISEIIDLNESEDNCNTVVNNSTHHNNHIQNKRAHNFTSPNRFGKYF